MILRETATRFGLKVLVETGTYLGDTVAELAPHFAEVHSIELSPELHARAARRFRDRKGIRLYLGDSGKVLPEILGALSQPAIFWLDGHYSGGATALGSEWSPVLKELEAILTHPVSSHAVLIDDARCFGTEGDYPTLSAVRDLAARLKPDWTFAVENDIVRILPPLETH